MLSTSIGMFQGHEVVEVEFDPAVLDVSRLVAVGLKSDCAAAIWARSARVADKVRAVPGVKSVEVTADAVDTGTQQQYDLFRKPEFYYLPLTRAQASRLDSARSEDDMKSWLSPAQVALSARIAKRLAEDKGALNGLVPVRGEAGIAKYAAELESKLAR